MAHRLLHGTLHATILEADKLSDPTRATGGAPQIFRKVSSLHHNLYLQPRK
jgi:phospholipase D1/2